MRKSGITQPALSKESDAHKFWYGNGGKVVLLASIYGLYYWLYEEHEYEVISPKGFSLHLKPNQTQINLQNWNYLAGQNEEYLNFKYDFLISQPVKPYGFIGVNREISFIGQAGVLAKQVDVYGFGFSYLNNSRSKISLEFSKLSSYDEFNNESIKLEYSLSF